MKTLALLAVMGGAVTGLGMGVASTAAPMAEPSTSATIYYRCESGLTFEQKDGLYVRCRRAAYTDPNPMVPCASVNVAGYSVGTSAVVDSNGNTDQCVGQPPAGLPPVKVNRICSPTDLANGWVLKVRAGADGCEKQIPEEIDYPYNQVNR